MIGRALLKNPFLLEEYYQGALDECQKNRRFEDFVWDFYTIQSKRIQAEKSLLNVMKEYWQYFSAYFFDATAVFNHLKRCKTKADFENKMAEIFRAINTYNSQSPNS
jgi:tRNA-dihydrouridine synthase